jgi:hypothetical protein
MLWRPCRCVNRLFYQRGGSIYIYNPIASYKITYFVVTLSYDNCYANLRDYSNSLLCDLLQHYGKYPHVL